MNEAGGRLCRRVVQQPWYQAAERVALFAAIHNEPDLRAVLEGCLARGACAVYPKIRGRSLRFVEVRSWGDLRPGPLGIPEPVGPVEVDIATLDLVLTPGLVFDLQGGRLGYGKGFYDRAFEPLRSSTDGPLRMGVAWELQLLADDQRAPTRSHDVPLHGLVTEQRTIRFGEDTP